MVRKIVASERSMAMDYAIREISVPADEAARDRKSVV